MDTRTETMQPCTIAYMRRTGAYGIECKAVMEQLKLWAKQTNNLNDDSIILGIALDNPEVTAPESCRYDVYSGRYPFTNSGDTRSLRR